jgi:hypothetical protein
LLVPQLFTISSRSSMLTSPSGAPGGDTSAGAALYILKPAQEQKAGEVGTGGTPFTVYLKKHIRETWEHRV